MLLRAQLRSYSFLSSVRFFSIMFVDIFFIKDIQLQHTDIMVEWLAYLFLTYILTSLLLFLFPTLLHAPKKFSNPLIKKSLSSRKILRIAHRGGARHSIQNTIQAFTHVEKVSDCIEMDVCETGDRVLVVHHDHHLKRTCGVDRDIQQYSYGDLPGFLEEIVLDFGYRLRVKSNKEKIPKLQDVFKKFPNMMMNIQLKTPTDTAITEFIRLLNEHNRLNNTIIGARNEKNFQIKRKCPEIHNFMNDKVVHSMAIAYFLGFVPFMKFDESFLQIPVYSKQFEEWNLDRTPDKDKWRVNLFMKMVKIMNYLTRPLIWHLKRRGILSLGWVCNTKQAFDNAVSAGFQGIMTDDSFALDEYLRERGLLITE